MRKAASTFMVLAAALASAQATQVVSDFESAPQGVDGWTVSGDPVGGGPVRVASGGNPGGYAEVTDSGVGLVMYWVAPAKFRGDLSAFFGGTLSYDMRQAPLTGLFLPSGPGDVSIASAGTTLVYALPPVVSEYPQATFTTRTLRLDDQTAWHINAKTGALATNAQILSVLGGVTSLQIRAEYSLNIDTNGLDNVVLRDVSAVPEPASAALLLGGVALLAGWRRRQAPQA